jgi:hypothetical protein
LSFTARRYREIPFCGAFYAAQVPGGEIQSYVRLGLNPGLINTSGHFWTGGLCDGDR